MTISLHANGLTELAADLAAAPVRVVPALVKAVADSADDLQSTWQANARITAGDHGRLYPDSITAAARPLAGLLGSIVYEVGPDNDKPQGSMGRGFEYGSVNQPPHLDGTRATDTISPRFVARLSDALTVFG